MTNNSSSIHEQENLSKAIISGAITGGVLGALFGFLHEYGILIVPGISSVFFTVPMNSVITGTIIGVVAGVIIGGLIAFFSSKGKSNTVASYANSGKLELHEEQLNITKKRIQTSEVNMHKESFTEEKTFTVPVIREELVIENKSLTDDKIETIRIPIKEERIEIVKHPVALEDVSYHIEQFQENKCIEETLKKDKLKIDKEGSVRIVDVKGNPPDLS